MFNIKFLVLRITSLVALLALTLFGLGVGGWGLYHQYVAPAPTEQLRRQLKENLAQIDSYYLRLTSTAVGGGSVASHRLEIWSSPREQLRAEATSLEEGNGERLQVVVRDDSGLYYFDSSLKKFYPVKGAMAENMPVLTLEDYGHNIVEAAHFKLLGREDKTRHSYYLVEVVPKESYRHRCLDRIWLETESLLPVRIESYDVNLCLRQVTCFEQILLNPTLEAALFEADQPAAYES
ncbi:MAG: hypothetical protein GX973_05275 [Firmicutes bacterium]|nr:hypothetical protein [Bacillota bacterium]